MTKDPPKNVLKLIAEATARLSKPKPRVIPSARLGERIRLRKPTPPKPPKQQ